MSEHELFRKQSRLVRPTERTAGVQSSVDIFFCPINDNACSRLLGSTREVQNYSRHPLAVKKTEGKVRVLRKKNSWGTLGRDENGNISGYKSKKLRQWGISSAAVNIQTEKTSLQRFGFHSLTDNFLDWHICIQLASIWSTLLIPKLKSYKRQISRVRKNN